MAEALDVAARMRARRTLLTHFSQRYTKAASLQQHDLQPDSHVLLAFDMMRVVLGEYAEAACFVPVVQRLMEQMGD
ncbi:hypothetical protein CDD82_7204 [Ophiocordyceps australis]|uniref:ribonuclease Z n=1 Tax=Ophiocordyceps australis TaxID=1399860 RepID=A0A2C5YTH5_9HYPO|nr:hypothetical protein CDD82_7204 [Ophiocordyceps australis]